MDELKRIRNREEITRIIRNFQPDVVITHRLCDYHPDHRTASQLVLDTSFLLRVPHFCPDTPVPANNPVFAFSYDGFTDPRPFRMDHGGRFVVDHIAFDAQRQSAVVCYAGGFTAK